MTATNSNKKHIISTTATATATATISTNTLMYFLIALVLSLSQFHTVHGSIIISFKEEQCLEKTGTIFEGADKDLLDARHDFSSSMEMDMTSRQKMYAKYPEEKMKRYDTACTKNGGMLHTIKLDFFDCTLRGSNDDIELTLKNFANCMANVDECKDFGQEHLLQEAWEELGLHCALEDEETKKDPPASDNNNDDDGNSSTLIGLSLLFLLFSDVVDVGDNDGNDELLVLVQQSGTSLSSSSGTGRTLLLYAFLSFLECLLVAERDDDVDEGEDDTTA
mmetsp:Transcript_53998/g.58543  ORF Transcript_53998/g.58543 Transcript_53998/m.58543 type:complete len:278 (-) Transcript_53998:515-1348(-)